MGFLIKLLLAATIAYGAYWAYEQYEARLAAEEALKARPVVNIPEERVRKLECPTCRGNGKLVDAGGTVKFGYRCPVCDGRGHREISSKGTVCSECKGMGNVERGSGARQLSQRCPICDGSGLKKK